MRSPEVVSALTLPDLARLREIFPEVVVASMFIDRRSLPVIEPADASAVRSPVTSVRVMAPEAVLTSTVDALVKRIFPEVSAPETRTPVGACTTYST